MYLTYLLSLKTILCNIIIGLFEFYKRHVPLSIISILVIATHVTIAQTEFKKAVVYIPVVNSSGSESGHGAGTIFYEDETTVYILTAYHVVKNYRVSGKDIVVEFYRNPTRYKAIMAADWMDTTLDLAMLKVESNNLPNVIQSLSFIKGFSLEEGDNITAIGHRTGGGYEKWLDEISRINQPVGNEIKFSRNVVDRGFSGGPIVSENGKLAGIITDVDGPLGIAVKASLVEGFILGTGAIIPIKGCDQAVKDNYDEAIIGEDYDTVDKMMALQQFALEYGCIGHPYSEKVQEPNDIFTITPTREYTQNGRLYREFESYMRLQGNSSERKSVAYKGDDGFWVEEDDGSSNNTTSHNFMGRWATADMTAIWDFRNSGDLEVSNASVGTHATGNYQVNSSFVTGTLYFDTLLFMPTSGSLNFELSLNYYGQLEGFFSDGSPILLIKQ